MKFILIFCAIIFASAHFPSVASESYKQVEEKEESKGIASKEMKTDIVYDLTKSPPKPPQYISFLRDQLQTAIEAGMDGESNSKPILIQDRANGKQTKTQFYAWLPTQIAANDISHKTTVSFKQKPKALEGVTHVQVTVTIKEGIMEADQFPENAFVSMLLDWDENDVQKDLTQTLAITKTKKYYSFNITNFVDISQKQNKNGQFQLNIDFQLMSATSEEKKLMDFTKIFDVQVELPTMIYFYNGILPPDEDETKAKSRQRRSRVVKPFIYFGKMPPTTRCQRYDLLVKPEELLLPNIIGPNLLDLGYCSGTCQFPLMDYYYNFTIHSFLLSRYLIGRTSISPFFPRPSCVPATYKPLSILEEISPGNFLSEVIENMSVDTCGCR